MCFSICFLAILELTDEEVAGMLRRQRQAAADKKASDDQRTEGGVLAQPGSSAESPNEPELRKKAFEKVLSSNAGWLKKTFEDAVAYAKSHDPRENEVIERALYPEKWEPKPEMSPETAKSLAPVVQSLQNRGWKEKTESSGPNAGKTRYEFDGKQVSFDRRSYTS